MTDSGWRGDPGPQRATLAVVGTGNLARALCYSLATVRDTAADVVVVGRSEDKARQLCYVANARAACGPRPGVRFRPLAGAFEPSAVAGVAGGPLTGVVVCASTQSPWERLTAPSAWTALVQRAGFGVTLPFQAELALHVGRALAVLQPRPWLVNACFPDAVNPLLAALGVPVLCGVGNVALLAASVQAALGLPDQSRLAMLAHHVHLHAPVAGTAEALAWYDEQPVGDVGALLADQRAVPRTELNQITGHAAAQLVAHLSAGTDRPDGVAELAAHLPGPLGLPGGYPVTVEGTELRLRLPAGVSRTEAVAVNQRAALADGVVIDGDRVTFGPAAIAELERSASGLAAGWRATELTSVTAELDELRARLRRQPAEEEIRV